MYKTAANSLVEANARRRDPSIGPPLGSKSLWRVGACTILGMVLVAASLAAQDISFTTSGGITISGSKPWHAGFGNVNGLGVGTAPSGTTVITTGVSGGVLYTTPYNIVISGTSNGNAAVVQAYVSTNFAHPGILQVESCYPSSSCSGAGRYTVLSTNSASPTTIIPQPGITTDSTVTASLALFVSNADGAGTFTGSDSVTITFNVYRQNMKLQNSEVLQLDTPSESVQTAMQLALGTSTGLTISAGSGSPDFSASFGNVNGLGIGPGNGLSVVSATGGVTYGTPYLISPSFSSFISTACSVSAYVSSNFVNSSALALQDSGSASGPFTNISTLSGSPTVITTTGASGSSIARYLGVFVSSASGAGAFPGTSGGNGSDNATLTYTMTVP